MKHGGRGYAWMRPVIFLAVACLMMLMGTSSMAGTSSVTADAVNCSAKISWDVTDSAQITQFKCSVKPFKGKEMLQYFIELQNISDQPHRYRVQIINPQGKSVGGLLPRKGKPPVVAAGDKAKFTYPVAGYLEIPESLEVVVMELR